MFLIASNLEKDDLLSLRISFAELSNNLTSFIVRVFGNHRSCLKLNLTYIKGLSSIILLVNR